MIFLLLSILRLDFTFLSWIYLEAFASLLIRKNVSISCIVRKVEQKYKDKKIFIVFCLFCTFSIATIMFFHLLAFLIYFMEYVELYLFDFITHPYSIVFFPQKRNCKFYNFQLFILCLATFRY